MTSALLTAGLVAVALVAVWLLARYAMARGRAAAEAEAAEKGLEHARRAAERRDDLHKLTDAERAEWLLRNSTD